MLCNLSHFHHCYQKQSLHSHTETISSHIIYVVYNLCETDKHNKFNNRTMTLQLYIMNQQHNRCLPRPHTFATQDVHCTHWRTWYRLPCHSIMELCNVMEQGLQHITHCSHRLMVVTQVLTLCHRFCAEGCHPPTWHQPAVCLANNHWCLNSTCVARNYIPLSYNQIWPKLYVGFWECG